MVVIVESKGFLGRFSSKVSILFSDPKKHRYLRQTGES